MADLATLDRAFHSVMTRMVETGQASHYTEMAVNLGCTPEEARGILHELMATG